jgi:hypothetical protein
VEFELALIMLLLAYAGYQVVRYFYTPPEYIGKICFIERGRRLNCDTLWRHVGYATIIVTSEVIYTKDVLTFLSLYTFPNAPRDRCLSLVDIVNVKKEDSAVGFLIPAYNSYFTIRGSDGYERCYRLKLRDPDRFVKVVQRNSQQLAMSHEVV